ncbi:MAG TPA: GIY-YIG nuclease family protein [bacterium]|nr:GIY-YIG nuclease family protein [bacterium]
MKETKSWFLYMLRCADGSFYTGISNRLAVRVQNHSRGRGARYTKTRLPVELVFSRKIGTYPQALRRERRHKQKTHRAKMKLAEKWLGARAREKKRAPKKSPPAGSMG